MRYDHIKPRIDITKQQLRDLEEYHDRLERFITRQADRLEPEGFHAEEESRLLDIFTRTLRASVIIAACTICENSIAQLGKAEEALKEKALKKAELTNGELSLEQKRQLETQKRELDRQKSEINKARGTERLKLRLKYQCRLDAAFFGVSEWQNITILFEIRNAIAHAGENVDNLTEAQRRKLVTTIQKLTPTASRRRGATGASCAGIRISKQTYEAQTQYLEVERKYVTVTIQNVTSLFAKIREQMPPRRTSQQTHRHQN